MELIADREIVKAQQRVQAAVPYSEQITEVVKDLAAAGGSTDSPLLAGRAEIKNTCYVVITADRGLCGGYNAGVHPGRRRHLRQTRARHAVEDLGGRRRRHRLRALRRGVDRSGRRTREPLRHRLDRRSAPRSRRPRHVRYVPFFNYAYGDLSFIYEVQQHPSTRMGLADAGAHCRVDLRWRNADVHAHPLDGDCSRTETPARTRGPPTDPRHRELVRADRPWRAGSRAARRHQRHRLRQPLVREAAHGVRPACGCSASRPEGGWIPPDDRGWCRDGRRRRIHRRAARAAARGPR